MLTSWVRTNIIPMSAFDRAHKEYSECIRHLARKHSYQRFHLQPMLSQNLYCEAHSSRSSHSISEILVFLRNEDYGATRASVWATGAGSSAAIADKGDFDVSSSVSGCFV
jgi:hypothetical protein